MKDSLGKFIKENREAFDSQTPPASAWKKIESSIPGNREKMFLDSVVFWRAAAIVLFGIAAYLVATRPGPRPNRQDVAEIQGFSDLDSYYSSQISEKMELVRRYQSTTGMTEDEVTQNLKKLEAMYLVLKDEMKRRPTQDVKDALVLNLLVRIDLINQQLNKLDKPTAIKTKSIQS